MSASGSKSAQTALVVATSNVGKLRELGTLLPGTTRLLSLSDLSLKSPHESGQSFLDNALLKAEHACRASKRPAIADDSGLEVDALDGRPGVISARFAGDGARDEDNNYKLIQELSRIPGAARTARFVCAVAFYAPDGLSMSAVGTVQGKIVDKPRGTGGFGYDPHFEIEDIQAGSLNGRTMAELSLEEKSRISHRRRAIDNLLLAARSAASDHPELQILVGA